MSLPDIDYELRDVGQSEYVVGLAKASTPEQMEFVASAFRAGQLKEQQRILNELSSFINTSGHVELAFFQLEKIIKNG